LALIPLPSEHRFTPAKASLGKKLYFDPRLSAASSQSCASCHSPGFGWGDGMASGSGRGTTRLERRSPTIINSAWGAVLTRASLPPTTLKGEPRCQSVSNLRLLGRTPLRANGAPCSC